MEVEIKLNNRLVTNLKDDVQQFTLTPHATMFGLFSQLPEDDPDAIESRFKKACIVFPTLSRCTVEPMDRGVHNEP